MKPVEILDFCYFGRQPVICKYNKGIPGKDENLSAPSCVIIPFFSLTNVLASFNNFLLQY